MSQTIAFRGARINHVDLRLNSGTCYAILHCSSDFTAEVAEHMQWQDLLANDHFVNGPQTVKLIGDEVVQGLTFISNGNVRGLECAATRMKGFTVSRVKNSKTKSVDIVLRFYVTSGDTERITEFYRLMGAIDGRLEMELPAQTSKLFDDGEEEREESKQATLPSAGSLAAGIDPTLTGGARKRALEQKRREQRANADKFQGEPDAEPVEA